MTKNSMVKNLGKEEEFPFRGKHGSYYYSPRLIVEGVNPMEVDIIFPSVHFLIVGMFGVYFNQAILTKINL